MEEHAVDLDWSLGQYEPTGESLLPISEIVVAMSEPLAGKRVVDLGCGTGNAALLAAARGAVATGVDPAARLVEVARKRAVERGLQAEFLAGDAAAIPVEDGTADVLLSIFAVIFAPDADAAIAEMARVTAPGGVIRLTSWVPGGSMMTINTVAGRFMAEVFGSGPTPDPEAPKPLAWHDEPALREAFAKHGLEVEVEQRSMHLTASSPEEYLTKSGQHPMAVSAAQALATRPDSAQLEADLAGRLLTAVREINEDPTAFQVSNNYAIVTARHG
ncbi:class I SAM-dependent methyltransferase [Kribbella sp. CA-293567]|uniref:class I SAM-dependent methyltransferase n=1 Tax=Kribbella sp. CA-293567 TaxID=3002436 RepID=UPI0022DDE58A|nr:class I SAM-dependent methyltransferase [Kribbella sp. CA-293567]WBQ07597.1 class I SAM-dependent methyltransferase [Kribbella sp. CA-293567]